MRIRCGSLSITTPVSLLANEFDVRSVLHGQVSLAVVNQMCVVHEAMNGCKDLKIHLRIASKIIYLFVCFLCSDSHMVIGYYANCITLLKYSINILNKIK